MDNRLTILITCKNEEQNILDCLKSVRGLGDEILVADSGSTDRTLDIVREFGGCRIIERAEYVNCGNFKNWAIPQASCPWVLVVDSDERVPPELFQEIQTLLAGEPACDGYRIRFRTIFLGQEIKHCGYNTTSGIRLMRRAVCKYREMRVHNDVDVATNKVGMLRSVFMHHTCTCLTEYLEKVNRYTMWSALSMFEKGKRVSLWGLLFRSPFRFLQMYLLRGGVLDGATGLIVCAITGYYNFMKYAKLWELQRNGIEVGLAAERNREWKGPSTVRKGGNALPTTESKAA
jgi:glycosyltransferase involved in cell wall biosynthesis